MNVAGLFPFLRWCVESKGQILTLSDGLSRNTRHTMPIDLPASDAQIAHAQPHHRLPASLCGIEFKEVGT